MEHNMCGAPLIKFKNQDIINSLQAGNVYMNSLEYFRRLEDEDTGIGDSYEGKVHVKKGRLIIPELGINMELTNDLINTSIQDAYVYCFTSFHHISGIFTFSDFQKEKLAEAGERALIITDRNEFIKRITNKLIKEGYKVSFGYVSYYKPEIDEVLKFFELLSIGIDAVALQKREKYSYQQEFRFIAYKENSTDDHICINIGDISDISLQYTSKQVLSATIICQDS